MRFRYCFIGLICCIIVLCSWQQSLVQDNDSIATRLESVQHKADSIVILFYGEENFKNHIQINKQYCAYRFGMYEWSVVKFTDTLVPQRMPYSYHYSYSIRYPMYGCCAEITFDMDSVGNLIWDNKAYHNDKTEGLSSSIMNPDFTKTIDSATAVGIARRHGMKKEVALKTGIRWYYSDRQTLIAPSDSVKMFHHFNWGCWVWEVNSREGDLTGMTGCVRYMGQRIWYIDAFTGEYIGTKDQ